MLGIIFKGKNEVGRLNTKFQGTENVQWHKIAQGTLTYRPVSLRWVKVTCVWIFHWQRKKNRERFWWSPLRKNITMPTHKKSLFSFILSGKGCSQFYYFDAVNFHGGWQPKPTVMFINAAKCLGKRLVSRNLQSTDSSVQLCLVGTMCSNIMPCGIRNLQPENIFQA